MTSHPGPRLATRWLAVGVVVAALVPAIPSATASPLTDADVFESQLDAAVDASGAFAPGTTLTHEFRYHTDSSRSTMRETVNPDGSTIASFTSTVSRVDVTCTGQGACWELAEGKYLDTLWHALPAESVHLSDGFHGQPFGFPAGIDGATYDVTAVPDQPGTTVFTMVDHGRGAGEVSVTYTVTITPDRIDYAVTRADRDVPEWTESYASRATAVPVAGPDRSVVGRPGSWTPSYYVMLRRNAPDAGS